MEWSPFTRRMGIQLTSFCAVTADWRGAEWRGDSWQENFNIANTEIQTAHQLLTNMLIVKSNRKLTAALA